MRQRVHLRAFLSVSSHRRCPCWSAGFEVLAVMRVMVDELLERNGNVCLGNLYAHIAGLQAASHRTSLAVDARVPKENPLLVSRATVTVALTSAMHFCFRCCSGSRIELGDGTVDLKYSHTCLAASSVGNDGVCAEERLFRRLLPN